MKQVLFTLLISLFLAACDTSSNATQTRAAIAGDASTGQKLFLANCSECPGADARGTDKGPPLIHKIYEPSHHADIAFVLAAKQGVRQHHWPFGDMPAQPEVSEQQIRDIIGWVRQEQRKAGIY